MGQESSTQINNIRLCLAANLITDRAVVVNIRDYHFHCGLSYEQSIGGCDVQKIDILLFSIEWPLDVNLPFVLDQAESELPFGVPSCKKSRKETVLKTFGGISVLMKELFSSHYGYSSPTIL